MISLFICFGAWAKSLEQKKIELKKIYEAGGISKAEYNNAQDFLGNLEEKTKDNPWAICTASVGRDNKEKYERCVKSVKKEKGVK